MGRDTDARKDKVRRQFGRNAWKYVNSEGHSRGPDLEDIVEWLHPSGEWVCLDIATGGGHVARILSAHVGTVVVSDLTGKMLQAARSSLLGSGVKNAFFVQADAESLPFLDSTFDAVTCRIAPHHFSDKDRFVSEASRVLKSGGKFLMVDNVTPEEHDLGDFMNAFEYARDPSHVSCASPIEWKNMIHGNGMKVTGQRLRKKTYTFRPWAERTAESGEQIERVEKLILSASDRLRDYYGVVSEGDHVASLQVDEMMVLAIKS